MSGIAGTSDAKEDDVLDVLVDLLVHALQAVEHALELHEHVKGRQRAEQHS